MPSIILANVAKLLITTYSQVSFATNSTEFDIKCVISRKTLSYLQCASDTEKFRYFKLAVYNYWTGECNFNAVIPVFPHPGAAKSSKFQIGAMYRHFTKHGSACF